MAARQVLLYELNEVPWSLLDQFTRSHPGSALGSLLQESRQFTTVNADDAALQPWRTWPTLHNSMHTAQHNSYDLGQDPASFRGTPLWDAAAAAGRSVGLFGVMQSWPARTFPHGGFFVPDTFAATSETVPASLERFQRFNLKMTSENGFSSDTALSPLDMVRVAGDISRHGLTARSTTQLVRHLWREVRDGRHKAGRSMMQVLPSFDLFWSLYRSRRPDLGIFFTNHVAGMMHRYWGDMDPGYDDTYARDEVFGTFVMSAMEIFDSQLARVLALVRRSPGLVLVVASSMGQGPVPHRPLSRNFVVTDPHRLASFLGVPSVETGRAMYPRFSFTCRSEADAARLADRVVRVRTPDGPLFGEVRSSGRSVSFAVDVEQARSAEGFSREFTYDAGESGQPAGRVSLEELGLEIRNRMGSGNTAYHVPDGVLIVRDGQRAPDASRERIDILDVAPYVLDVMGVAAPESMCGSVAPALATTSVR